MDEFNKIMEDNNFPEGDSEQSSTAWEDIERGAVVEIESNSGSTGLMGAMLGVSKLPEPLSKRSYVVEAISKPYVVLLIVRPRVYEDDQMRVDASEHTLKRISEEVLTDSEKEKREEVLGSDTCE